MWSKTLPNFSGHSTASFSSCLASSRAPMSSHLTLGFSIRTSLMVDGCMSFSAFLKSSFVTEMEFSTSLGISSASRSTSGSTLLRAAMAASLVRADRSAPAYPWVLSASHFRSTSSARGMPLVWISRISRRPSLSGMPISISLSNLPGLLSASSMELGLLVAPMTTTLPLEFRPSIRDRSWATMRLSSSPLTSSLFGAIESISSMKMMLGAFSSASLKISLSLPSDSP